MQIRSKRQFFELWEAGVLGNRTRLWRDPQEAHEWAINIVVEKQWKEGKLGSFPPDVPEIGFRELRKPGSAGAGKWEKVPWTKVFETAERWRAEGRDFIMDDACPNEQTTLCGEVVRTFLGTTGHLAIEPRCGMRQAKLEHRSPLVTKALLEKYMDPSSRDDLDALLDLYPDAAVEFSCFPFNVGVLPHRNTLFWETRNY